MRIALDPRGDVGTRCGRILLGEPGLTAIGLIDKTPTGHDDRLESMTDLASYDLVVTDAIDAPTRTLDRALEAGIGCVVFADGDHVEEQYGRKFAEAGLSLLVGANLASGIAPCLATHETARGGEILDVTIAWTEPGSPIRRGEPIPFPDPVGARWARPRKGAAGYDAYVAPITGDWAAAIARVTSAVESGVVTRIVGVADLAPHLEALALAAGALTLGAFPPGSHHPVRAAGSYLGAALEAGLEVAAYSIASS
ncbi:MAG: hypothetical protein ACE5GC_08295 [Acidimicrobiia bacterium]